MHSAQGDTAAITPVYALAIEQFVDVDAATDTVQPILLMAQMVAAGMDADCCLAIDCSLGGEQLTWVTEILGTDFITQVKAVACQTYQSDGIAVRFAEHELPRLSVF